MFLNRAIKDRAIQRIRDFVKYRYAASPAGKELEAARKKLASKIRKAHVKIYPLKDMAVLEKYGSCEDVSEIKFSVSCSEGGVQLNPWSHHRKEFPMVEFDPPLLKPRRCSVELSAVPVDDFMVFEKMYEDIKCEISEVVSAYTQRFDGVRTVKRLLESYPDMKAFFDNGKELPMVDDGEKLISEFVKK